MTDAHCHVDRGDSRSFVCEPTEGKAMFVGHHPWEFLGSSRVGLGSSSATTTLSDPPPSALDTTLSDPPPSALDTTLSDANLTLKDPISALRSRLAADSSLGVGEIGLDRLQTREIPAAMREAFEAQLRLAAEFSRPVVLHGAKCWGQVVEACRRFAGKIPTFLFHGFSRSGGLIPEIVRINGFMSVGPAVLNDHAVNYRELVKAIPSDRLLVESDATAENMEDVPRVAEVAAKVAEIRGTGLDELVGVLEANSDRFLGV